MFEQVFNDIDDILWKGARCTSELDYAEQASWLLFLKYLDGLEQDKATEAELEGRKYTWILGEPYRWDQWAVLKGSDGTINHNKLDLLNPKTQRLATNHERKFATLDEVRKSTRHHAFNGNL
jgi:hypothetical protein